MVTAFCPVTVIQTGETMFVVDCNVNPVAFVGHVKMTFVPEGIMVSRGEDVRTRFVELKSSTMEMGL